eukprot:gene3793-4721_t
MSSSSTTETISNFKETNSSIKRRWNIDLSLPMEAQLSTKAIGGGSGPFQQQQQQQTTSSSSPTAQSPRSPSSTQSNSSSGGAVVSPASYHEAKKKKGWELAKSPAGILIKREFSTTTNNNNKESSNNNNNNNESNSKKSTTTKKSFGITKLALIASFSAILVSYGYFKANGQDVKVEYVKRIPFRLTSSLWGKMANIELPVSLREPIYKAYSRLFGVKLDEVEKPLQSYTSMADFFSRRLKPNARVIDQKAGMVSPVDGTVIYFGRVDKDSLEQVKGLNYSLSDFLGEEQIKSQSLQDKNLYHVGIYLSPGDYHGIHSPVDWKIRDRYHFPGYLFPVAKVAVDNIPGLFAMNERVVLSGSWKHGYFSLTPVGASNVGSIVMDFDNQLLTNNKLDRYKEKNNYYHRSYSQQPVDSKRGSEVAFFKMGSTVILIFEVPKDKSFDFYLKPGQSLQFGQPIGRDNNRNQFIWKWKLSLSLVSKSFFLMMSNYHDTLNVNLIKSDNEENDTTQQEEKEITKFKRHLTSEFSILKKLKYLHISLDYSNAEGVFGSWYDHDASIAQVLGRGNMIDQTLLFSNLVLLEIEFCSLKPRFRFQKVFYESLRNLATGLESFILAYYYFIVDDLELLLGALETKINLTKLVLKLCGDPNLPKQTGYEKFKQNNLITKQEDRYPYLS